MLSRSKFWTVSSLQNNDVCWCVACHWARVGVTPTATNSKGPDFKEMALHFPIAGSLYGWGVLPLEMAWSFPALKSCLCWAILLAGDAQLPFSFMGTWQCLLSWIVMLKKIGCGARWGAVLTAMLLATGPLPASFLQGEGCLFLLEFGCCSCFPHSHLLRELMVGFGRSCFISCLRT